jgi:nicotinate-nucleotide adenylyltransferase
LSALPLGIFGGTFDPIHFGHLRLAQELAEGLALAEVRFIPAGCPPHRGKPGVSATQRLDMVRLAIAGNERFVLDEREILKQAPSYAVETLAELRRELGGTRPLCLFLGADAFMGLATWHRWQELFDYAHIVVAQRPGFSSMAWEDNMPEALKKELHQRLQTSPQVLRETPAGAIVTFSITALDISATYIRNAIKSGKNPRYLLPDAVLQYIQQNHLYSEMNETR